MSSLKLNLRYQVAQKILIQQVAMERKCKIDELVSANVDYFSFSPQSKSWLKSQTPPSIMPRAMQKPLLMAKFDRNGR